jgi:predicted N-formylglutamate amidohydrolase
MSGESAMTSFELPYDGTMNLPTPDLTGQRDEDAVFEIINPQGAADVLLICDHASNRIPPGYDDLGLAPELLQRHIAWDIGAADVTRRISQSIDCPAILSGYSRLFVDVNRQAGNPGWMPEVSDHIEVPGNRGLDEAEIARRKSVWYDPYHAAVERLVDGFLTRDVVPAIYSIHSFTPIMDGFERPWHVGVLWNLDSRLALPLSSALSAFPGAVIGDNEPYAGSDPSGYSIHIHGEERGVPVVAVEVRQDLIDTHHGAEVWAGRLAAGIKQTVAAGQPWTLEPNPSWEGALKT